MYNAHAWLSKRLNAQGGIREDGSPGAVGCAPAWGAGCLRGIARGREYGARRLEGEKGESAAFVHAIMKFITKASRGHNSDPQLFKIHCIDTV